MQRLVLQKRGKGNEVSVLNVSATGLSLCTEQRVDFVWEMGDWELTLNAVSFTQQISFLVLICDAKTWSLKKEKGNEVSVLNVLSTEPSLFADQRVDSAQEMGSLGLGLETRDGWLRIDPQQGQFHPTNLFLSFNLWCKDLVPKQKEKEMQWVCWLFWPLDCLYALNREWTLCKRWVTKSWPTKESVSPN